MHSGEERTCSKDKQGRKRLYSGQKSKEVNIQVKDLLISDKRRACSHRRECQDRPMDPVSAGPAFQEESTAPQFSHGERKTLG